MIDLNRMRLLAGLGTNEDRHRIVEAAHEEAKDELFAHAETSGFKLYEELDAEEIEADLTEAEIKKLIQTEVRHALMKRR